MIVHHPTGTTQPIAIRRATPADEEATAALLAEAERQVMHIPLCEAMADEYCYLLERNGRPVALCGISLIHRPAARLRTFALRDDMSVTQALDLLLTPAIRSLGDRGVQKLFYIGAEGWLLRGLYAVGFRLQGTIVLLQKTDFAIPAMGNRKVTVRPATCQDLDRLLEIDEAAFTIPWQVADKAFRYFLNCYPFFVVAELDDKVVGYAYAYLLGCHGHLSRIAVHPCYGGRGIGTRLLAEVILFFKQKGVFGITLNTQADNQRARRLYERFGFQVIGRDAWVLARDIRACAVEVQEGMGSIPRPC